MARIAGINIPPHKHAEVALTAIYGIGRNTARKICAASGIQPNMKIKDLSEAEIEQVGAWIMAADPITLAASAQVAAFLD